MESMYAAHLTKVQAIVGHAFLTQSAAWRVHPASAPRDGNEYLHHIKAGCRLRADC